MRVMDELTESHRRTPSFQHAGAQSPRVGGCVGAFFNMFDWNPSKRFSSTKRITADRPNSEALCARRDRSFTERTNPTGSKLPLINEEKGEALSTLKNAPSLSSTPSPASVKSEETSKRVPGVVARLMGLESLPNGAYPLSKPESQYLHSTLALEQLDSPPVLLQELLRQEFQHSKKSLKEKLPGFSKKASQDAKLTRGPASQRKKPTGHFGEHVHPYGDSRAPRPARPSEKAASSTQEDGNKTLAKQPFLARLQTGTATLLPSKSQNSNSSPLLSPAMLGGKNTVRLLEAAVTSMQPSPRSRYCLTRNSYRDTQSESGASLRSERRAITSSYGRGGSSANSSSRSLRSQPVSRSDKAEQSGHPAAESGSPGSRSFRSRHDSCKQEQASRRRSDMGLVKASSPQQNLRPRIANSKRVENSPRAVLGTHEAATRGFKIDLENEEEALVENTGEKREIASQCVESDVLVHAKLPPTPPRSEATDAKAESPVPCTPGQNTDAKANAGQGSSPSMSKATPEKAVSGGGFRSMRFRGRTGKQEREVGGQGNRVFPSEKHPVETSFSPSPPKEAKVAGAGFSYSMLFSGRKQGDKKEGNGKGEALAMKRTDSTLLRSLLRRPSGAPGASPMPTTKSVSQNVVKKPTKPSKKVDAEEDVKEVEPAPVVASQCSSLMQKVLSEETLSPTQKQLDGSLAQARCRSIDDVFPELPMEANNPGGASPDLGKIIQAVEDKFLGLGPQGEPALLDCRSIERMFGKGFSRSYVSGPSTSPDFSSLESPGPGTSPFSPEVFVTECGSAPGTFPNSPLVKYEKIFFSSRSHLNLQDMFEVVSGDRPHDLAGRRQSFSLSEPRERGLAPSDDDEAGADLDTCSNSAVCDTGGTPERLEIQKMSVDAGWSEDVMVTPPALKKFEEKLAQCALDSDVSCAEECGQPSPVSVLDNPFLDEVPTTPELSLAGPQQTDDDEEPTPATKKTMPAPNVAEVASPEMIETEKIKKAILDISRFRNIDVTSIGLEPPTVAPVDPQHEQNYVREVLDAANLLREESKSGWYSAESPMNQSLFDRLEFGSIKLDERTLMESKRWGSIPDAPRQGSGIRSERKLLFDSVNEVMALEPWMKTSSFYVDLPMFPDMYSNSKFRSPISGEPLVKEVYRMIRHWRDIAGNVLDDLIDYDMNVPEGRWVDFRHEVADIGLDMEQMLLNDLIEEVANDFASSFTRLALTTSF